MENSLIEALRFLADNTRQGIDGQGFSRYDAAFGQSLASAQTFTVNQANAGQKLAKKYRNQLSQAGFDVETLASQAKVDAKKFVYRGTWVYKTNKAIQLDNGAWLPLSQISYELDACGSSNAITVEMPTWLAKAKNLF